jgi:hypothetical protein
MFINEPMPVTFSAISTIILDGSTATKTYQPADRIAANSVALSKRADDVIIDASVGVTTLATVVGTVAFKIYGYAEKGPAELIYSGTATAAAASTGIAGTLSRYVTTFSTQAAGLYHEAIDITVPEVNGITSMNITTRGVKYLLFEVSAFNATAVTSITFNVREYGSSY